MTILGRPGFERDRILARARSMQEDNPSDTAVPEAGRQPESRRPIPLPSKKVKTRNVQWKAFSATELISTAAVVGETNDNSMEGQLERWRQTLPGVENEKELVDWEWRIGANGKHYLLIAYTE